MADEKEKAESTETAAGAPAAESGKKKLDPRLQLILDHVWGPTGSVVLHIVLVVLLLNMVMAPTNVEKPEIEVTVIEPHAQDLEKFEKELEKLQPVENDIKPPDMSAPSTQPSDVANVSSETAAFGTATTPSDDLAALDVKSDSSSPLVMKGLFAGRSAAGRGNALRTYGGRSGGAAEAAILKALEWLKNHQLPDGSWEGTGAAKNKVAMTGMALLTFLAHGETHTSEKYGPTVDKAIKWLVAQQKENGVYDNGNSYANGIAEYAMSESYALTRIPELRAVMEKGATFIIAGQQDTGAYTYLYAKNGRRDTSVAGWQGQALKAAFAAGADVPGLKEAMKKCCDGFSMNYAAASGKFKYAPEPGKPGNDSWACTGIGVLNLQLLHGNQDHVEGGLKALADLKCSWDDPGTGSFPMYAWYYITQAKFHKGKSTWDAWNNLFAKEVVGHQNSDGSWTPIWGSEKEFGPVYGTTFSALTLMVYYRFLPSYKQIKVEEVPTEKKPDDVVVL